MTREPGLNPGASETALATSPDVVDFPSAPSVDPSPQLTSLKRTVEEAFAATDEIKRLKTGPGRLRALLGRAQDERFGALLIMALNHLSGEEQINGSSFLLVPGTEAKQDRIRLFVMVDGYLTQGFEIPKKRFRRAPGIQTTVDQAIEYIDQDATSKNVSADNSVAYKFDPRDIAEKGAPTERALFIDRTATQLDHIATAFVQGVKDPEVADALARKRDELIIGRLIYMEELGHVPGELGYHVSVTKKSRGRIRVGVSLPGQSEDEEGFRVYNVDKDRPRSFVLSTILSRATEMHEVRARSR